MTKAKDITVLVRIEEAVAQIEKGDLEWASDLLKEALAELEIQIQAAYVKGEDDPDIVFGHCIKCGKLITEDEFDFNVLKNEEDKPTCSDCTLTEEKQ